MCAFLSYTFDIHLADMLRAAGRKAEIFSLISTTRSLAIQVTQGPPLLISQANSLERQRRIDYLDPEPSEPNRLVRRVRVKGHEGYYNREAVVKASR